MLFLMVEGFLYTLFKVKTGSANLNIIMGWEILTEVG